MDYNTLYKKNPITDNTEASPLLTGILKRIPTPSVYLDLGCGQGKDALFMATAGHHVTAIDSSSEAISQLQLKKIATEKDISLDAICSSIEEFNIESEKYTIISACNSLHYLAHNAFFATIDAIKDGICAGGFAIISTFTTEDPGFKNENSSNKTYLKPQEMLKLFSEYRIYNYFENIVLDPGHPGMPEPHTHGIVKIVAQKL